MTHINDPLNEGNSYEKRLWIDNLCGGFLGFKPFCRLWLGTMEIMEPSKSSFDFSDRRSSAIPGRIKSEKEWEYLDAFQNKKECQFASEENLDAFISAQQAMFKKTMDEESAQEAASQNWQLPLEKRFPKYDLYIDTQRVFGRNDKEIEGLILKQIEQKKKEETPSEVRVDEDGIVHLKSGTYTFICIPITIDPRMKG